jgi:cytochrome c oxidase accessory protein FixG
MSLNPYELHPERLATTDEKGNRIYLHPEDIKGKWKNRRRIVYWCLILFYLVLPWIHIDGKQILLLDLFNRRFTIFGIEFWGHDAPYMFFFVAGGIFLIAFATSLFGRVWCGWACPQTVFIDAVYRQIERLVEGKSRVRIKLDASPWNLQKISRRGLKWLLFLLVSLIISHSFLGYFVGTYKLWGIMTHEPSENWTAFIVMLVATGICLFDFGWFREQFCIIACPYGRFQSVMLDANSLVVAYDQQRGEPRGPVNQVGAGDCINCYHCVSACPTGIDIRRGMQLECINCTMCIDACDNVMDKVNKPQGLIRYTSENALAGKKVSFFRPRSLIYLSVFMLLMISSYLFLSNRSGLKVFLVRGQNVPFQLSRDQAGEVIIVNHYRAELFHQDTVPLSLNFKLTQKDMDEGLTVVSPIDPFELSPGKKNSAQLFFKFKKKFLKQGSRIITLEIHNKNELHKTGLIEEVEVSLVGPY